ncbi:unnamed protein product [Paramecium octaurelia]|uniref:Malate dehydrogenase n=1 Tax=Paramecium octaurelia TaxID=43137 RepID=A0A8S1WXL1_PAROT|nr:unnamed protein product [Paramecium octaurelia]
MDSSATTRRLQHLSRHFKASNITTPPVRVTVTGAAGNIGYALVHMIGQGRLLGPNQQIILTLLELPMAKDQLEGTMMELRDCAFPILKEIRGTTQYDQGFMGCDIAILVGAKPRGPGMERKDLLAANARIFKEQGEALEKYASRNVKVLVVGNPANTNALITAQFAPSIPKSNFTALTRLDQNRASSIIAQRVSANVEDVRNIVIWGNHSTTQFADVSQATVQQSGISYTVRGLVADDAWLQKAFVEQVAKRGGAIIEKRKASSAASAASAVCDHIHDWLIGTDNGTFVSMGVITDGKLYGIKEQVCFSFPCICKDGNIKVVEGLKWDQFQQSMIDKTLKELLEEKDMAFSVVVTK